MKQCRIIIRQSLKLKKRKQSWHLTLDYLYNRPRDDSETALLKENINNCLATFIGNNPILKFDPPHVCWYHSMAKFNPIEIPQNDYTLESTQKIDSVSNYNDVIMKNC